MLSATSFQITLLSGQNWQAPWQAYVLGGIFLLSSGVWYGMFRLKPSVWILSAPWFFFALAFFLVGLPSVSSVFRGATTHKMLTSTATWSYAVASAAAFTFFGLNFGEEAVGISPILFFMISCLYRVQPPKFGHCGPLSSKALNKSGSPLSGTGATL
jgi:alpha-1,3-glucan synthase